MARLTHLDLDVLRSFAAGMSLGSYAKAADRLGRSTSAISAQLKKLEEQAGTAIFRKSGRGLALTDAGETLLAYAHRLLDLNDEAVAAVRGADLEGWVRLGLQEDFGEALLPEVLGRFARAHPKVRIEARVARNADLVSRLHAGQLDLVLAWSGSAEEGGQALHAERVGDVPMQWIAAAAPHHALRVHAGEPLPLVAFEAPCSFRSAPIDALDRAGVAWRVAFTSASLGGLWAAAAAGLGLMVRTRLGLPRSVRVLDAAAAGLPVLPSLPLMLYRAETVAAAPVECLASIVLQSVRGALAAVALAPAVPRELAAIDAPALVMVD